VSVAATMIGGTAPSGTGRVRAGDERRLLGDLLVEAGLVTARGLSMALEAQRLAGGRLGMHLMRGGHIVPAAFHLFLGEHLEAMRPDLLDDVRAGAAAGRVPARLAHHYGMVPVREQDGVLDLAVSTFDQPGLRSAVEALTGLRVEPIIAPPSLLAEALGQHYPEEVEPGILFRPAGDNILVLADGARGLRAAEVGSLTAGAPAGEWLRAITALALREGARRVEIEPRADTVAVSLVGRQGGRPEISMARGAYPGVAALLEGMARIASRGRIVPREGRFVVRSGGVRLFVSVLALPGLLGRIYRLDLRSERIAGPDAAAIAASLPALRQALDHLAARGRGLLGLAATGPSEWAAALDTVLQHLGERLGRRAVIGHWDDRGGDAIRDAIGSGSPRPPDGTELLVIGTPWCSGIGDAIGMLARDHVVLAAVDAQDACAGAEMMARGTAGPGRDTGPAGVLAVRHLESPCSACRRPFDLGELLALLPGGASAPAPAFIASGCAGCRGSGQIEMTRVAEFLALAAGRLARPGARARNLREESPGRPTILRSAVRGALDGAVDAREVLRLLVHEPR